VKWGFNSISSQILRVTMVAFSTLIRKTAQLLADYGDFLAPYPLFFT
jgi:hypothetical protein